MNARANVNGKRFAKLYDLELATVCEALSSRECHSCLLVYLAIARHRDGSTGVAVPSRRTIQEDVNLSPNTVRRSIARLRDLGLFRVEEGRGRGHTTRYLFPIVEGKEYVPYGE